MVIHYYAIFDRKAKSFGEPLAFGSPERAQKNELKYFLYTLILPGR